MPEVLKAFSQLDIGWKKTGAYNIKCRWVAPGPSSIEAAPTIDGLTDLPMAQSMPRLSSSGWAGDSYGGPNSVTTKNKDNEAGIRSNLVKFEVQVMCHCPLDFYRAWNLHWSLAACQCHN